jgi:hypothetical protein
VSLDWLLHRNVCIIVSFSSLVVCAKSEMVLTSWFL